MKPSFVAPLGREELFVPVFDLICVEIAEKISVQGNGSRDETGFGSRHVVHWRAGRRDFEQS